MNWLVIVTKMSFVSFRKANVDYPEWAIFGTQQALAGCYDLEKTFLLKANEMNRDRTTITKW